MDPLIALCRDTKQTQKLGPQIIPELAEVLRRIAEQGLTEAALKICTENLMAPENLQCEAEIPVNHKIWRTLSNKIDGWSTTICA